MRDLVILRALSVEPVFEASAMVAVAQLVESRIVIPAVVGSSPIRHPKNQALTKP